MLSCFSHVLLFATAWTVACQLLLSMGFSRKNYWSGLPCFPPGDLPNPGIEPASLTSPALTGAFSTIRATWEAYIYFDICPQFLAQSSYNPWNFLSNRECIGLAKKFFLLFHNILQKNLDELFGPLSILLFIPSPFNHACIYADEMT